MFELLLLDLKQGGRVTGVDQQPGNLIRAFGRLAVLHLDGAVLRRIGRVASGDKRRTSGFPILRAYKKPSPPVTFKFSYVEFLEQTPGVDDADSLGKTRDFSQNMT